MKRSLTPNKIAYRAGILSSLIITVFGFIPAAFLVGIPEAYYFIAAPFIVFGVTYGIYFWMMEKYIHQKIRLIYRTIHAEKIGRPLSSMKIDMNTDAFREVNRDVEDWAKDSRKEIQELKNKAEFRREFIGNLSHELKTPLTIIQGNILTLLEGAVEDVDVRERFLLRAADNVERLELLIRDLDRITSLESERDEMEPTKFNLIALAKEVIENLQEKASKHKIELKLITRPNQDIMVFADRHKIDQVFTNLIMNSIKYSGKDGKTTISFEELGDNILVEVKDKGIGIEEKHLPRLFERFYRVDKSRARHIGGTGLGLAIVKHIIDAHHQTLNVRSEIGKGSVFSFTLKKG